MSFPYKENAFLRKGKKPERRKIFRHNLIDLQNEFLPPLPTRRGMGEGRHIHLTHSDKNVSQINSLCPMICIRWRHPQRQMIRHIRGIAKRRKNLFLVYLENLFNAKDFPVPKVPTIVATSVEVPDTQGFPSRTSGLMVIPGNTSMFTLKIPMEFFVNPITQGAVFCLLWKTAWIQR